MFVGFDIKGNTLHTEFHTYVLPPIMESYHLVDRLPATVDSHLAAKVAGEMAKSFLGELAGLSKGLPHRSKWASRRLVEPADTSELGMDRFVMDIVDMGALSSVRELASSSRYLHYFQQSDATKYMKIVERRLLENIQTFLRDHHVDLADHMALQANILNGDINTNHGPGHMSIRNTGPVTQGSHSPISVKAKKP